MLLILLGEGSKAILVIFTHGFEWRLKCLDLQEEEKDSCEVYYSEKGWFGRTECRTIYAAVP